MSVDLSEGKAINVRTLDGWRDRTMERRTWSIDAYNDGECLFSQMRGLRNGQRDLD